MEDRSWGGSFLSYKNDDDRIVSGYFDIIEINDSFVKIRTKGTILIIPMHRVLKIKLKGGENHVE